MNQGCIIFLLIGDFNISNVFTVVLVLFYAMMGEKNK